MASCGRFAVAAVLAIASHTSFSQTPNTAGAQRDAQAVATLQKAVNVMGGAAVAGIQDCTAQASVQPTPDAHSSPYTITYKNSGDKFRYESARDGITTLTASDGHQYSRQVGTGKVERLLGHLLFAEFPKHLVAWVLYQRLQNQNYSLYYAGTATVNGRGVVRVSTRRESDSDWASLTAQVWSFDATTGLPVRVDWVIPLAQNADETVNATLEFSNYQQISGVLVPFQIITTVGGIKIDTTTLTGATLNSGISSTQFQLGGAP